MKAFIFLADGFEELEAIAPIDIFRRAQIEVTTVSIQSRKTVRGSHGIEVNADSLFSETDFANSDILYLPGGKLGTENLNAHEGLKQLIQKQAKNNKVLAAICAAPSILGKMGLLNGKEAVCYPGFEDELQGAILSKNKIVKSGLIHTAKGAGVSVQFALKLVEELKGKETANQIADSICI